MVPSFNPTHKVLESDARVPMAEMPAPKPLSIWVKVGAPAVALVLRNSCAPLAPNRSAWVLGSTANRPSWLSLLKAQTGSPVAAALNVDQLPPLLVVRAKQPSSVL